ncbi:alkaline phosphatase [Niallia sp. 01092]|uniref:alkaline phosphatase n=1 Tax=unclassified Niallia TaxID=2837522 RepID=UPI003FD10089
MKKIIISFLFIELFFIPFNLATAAEQRIKPKNIIFLIGDGMGLGQIEIARTFEYGKEGNLFLESLPYTALAHTYSANNKVTDSAAGGTALAIGKKTNNGMIGVTADGKTSPSILDVFKKNGLKTGIVTTNSVTDATPASFTASVKNRWTGQKEIAKQQLRNKVDVILGGGQKYFTTTNTHGTKLLDQYKQAGYEYVTTAKELQNANSGKLIGLFGPKHLNFKLDRDDVKSQEPSLSEMAAKALETLSKDNKGFFTMIEGARIDQASHAGDITSIWKETIEFDEAVKYCVKWAKNHPDTLVVVAADHETMGVSATEPMDVTELKKITVTPHYMASQLQKNPTGNGFTNDSIKHVFQKYAHITLTNKDVASFNSQTIPSTGQVYPEQHVAWEIGNIIAKHYHAGILDRSTEELSSTGGHTSNMIPVFAYGTGAENFHGVIDNTDIPKMLVHLMGYSF